MRDEYSVLLGGVVGTSALVVVMGTADVASGFTLRVFERLAGLAGTPEVSVVGVVVFVAIGVFAWPLVYLSLESYLPGGTRTGEGRRVRGSTLGRVRRRVRRRRGLRRPLRGGRAGRTRRLRRRHRVRARTSRRPHHRGRLGATDRRYPRFPPEGIP